MKEIFVERIRQFKACNRFTDREILLVWGICSKERSFEEVLNESKNLTLPVIYSMTLAADGTLYIPTNQKANI
jgi:hypothetical protein